MSETVIARRFRGPNHSGNGGYVAGVVAAAVGPSAVVTLRKPIPLETPLTLERTAEGARLMQGALLLGEAAPDPGPDDAPGPVPLDLARAASARPLIEDAAHAAPHCWVCGPHAPAHALHIRTGATGLAPGAGPPAAAVWNPQPEHAGADGLVDAVHLWSALDCPSGVAAMAAGTAPIDAQYLLLGRIAARIERRPPLGAPLVVTARAAGRDGRKRFAESAVHDAEGNRLALARAIWFEIDPARFEGVV
ncbi:MAG TPA: hypothetical protein VJ994_03080 [Paracoccaceae bacterium]|nr:hypothetical protein [Paracoccaceae bacterium]